MSAERKARWRKEIDWLLSVTDYIVEFVPSQQKSKDGTSMEVKKKERKKNSVSLCFFLCFFLISDLNRVYTLLCALIQKIMTTRQRTDLHMNIPALRKLDAMLIVRS